ncbi:MAG: alanine/ornithine racemase family PLP-dependent enzyme [Flavobacteriales bacterium]|jgi:predicted amino acid racemase|nr:alanine/ornithine racemase family PLP-dependent enzyme [Flavobacteriales bacterium]MCB0759218.1 alanine/ornithine racemase family PLP-dependent enzyme [Flavobacteriales bacterium]
MAFLELYRDKLRHNHRFLANLFKKNNIEWGIVTKLLCGNETFLREVVELGEKEFHDTRISNLKVLKKLAPDAQTVYIKPPAKRGIPNLVRFADVSFNSDLDTIKALSAEAVKQGRTHKVIIMVEMGDLREGVMGDHLVDFYAKVFELPNIAIVGLGTNLNCLNGIMPTQDKLIQLGLYKQLIETKFNKRIPWVTGGTSVTIPLLLKKQLPKGMNHFRVGEALFFGKDLFTDGMIKGMRNDVFKLHAEVIELYEKPMTPTGEQRTNVAGIKPEVKESDIGRTAFRAIIDIGLLDVNPKDLTPLVKGISIIEASSDMLVLDLGDNPGNIQVGDLISFSINYMGALGLMNSRYIDKVVRN